MRQQVTGVTSCLPNWVAVEFAPVVFEHRAVLGRRSQQAGC